MRIFFNAKRINKLNVNFKINEQIEYEYSLKFNMNAAFVDIDIKEGDDLKITLKPYNSEAPLMQYVTKEQMEQIPEYKLYHSHMDWDLDQEKASKKRKFIYCLRINSVNINVKCLYTNFEILYNNGDYLGPCIVNILGGQPGKDVYLERLISNEKIKKQSMLHRWSEFGFGILLLLFFSGLLTLALIFLKGTILNMVYYFLTPLVGFCIIGPIALYKESKHDFDIYMEEIIPIEKIKPYSDENHPRHTEN